MYDFHELSKQTGYSIYFKHVATETEAVFPGFVKTIKDSYQVGWTPVNVYGRMDPIVTYQRTSRSCTLTFDVLSDSVDRSRKNQRAIKTLIRMLYPKVSKVTKGGDGRVLSAPPLMRIRFANFFQSSVSGDGLLAAVKGIDYQPSMDAGFVHLDKGVAFAKEFTISINFDVLHEHELGWDQENKFLAGENFPYAEHGTNQGQFTISETTRISKQTRTGAARTLEVLNS